MPGIGRGSRNRINCSDCGRELWEKPVPVQIGPGSAPCTCGSLVATGKREWMQTTAAESRTFWATRRIIPVALTVCLTVGIVFGSWRNQMSGRSGLGFDWHLASWALLASVVLFGFDLTAKVIIVGRSLKRFPARSGEDVARGPWQQKSVSVTSPFHSFTLGRGFAKHGGSGRMECR